MPENTFDSKVTKSFCALPWLHLAVLPTGTAKICCVGQPVSSQDGAPMSLYEHTVEEIWNSQFLRDIRRDMLEGKPVSACTHCYRAEAAQGASMRTVMNAEWLDTLSDMDLLRETTIKNDYHVSDLPIYYQLMLGNLCNLSCRMCSSSYSAKIANDKVHSQWAPVDPWDGPILTQWKNDSLLVGPMPVAGVQYEGFHDIQSHMGKYFSWTSGNARIAVRVDEETQLSSIQIKFSDIVRVGTKFTVTVNDSIVFDGCVDSESQVCEIDISSLKIGFSLVEIKICSDSFEDFHRPNLSFGLPIEEVHLRRAKSKQKLDGKAERKFTISRFPNDAPWVEQDALLFGELLRDAKNIRKLYFTGGEPTLNKSLEEIIGFLSDVGSPEETIITFNSNGTIYNHHLLENLKRFKVVLFSLSTDASGEYYEYIRYPGRWSTVVSNIEKLREFQHPIHVHIAPSIQALNVMNITELLKFSDEQDLICELNNNFVTTPKHLAIYMLPEKALKVAAERLRKYSDSPASSENQRSNRTEALRLADYLDSIKQEPDFDLLRQFMLFTNDLDRSRNQDFKKVHPELLSLIVESGFEWTDETRFIEPRLDVKNNNDADHLIIELQQAKKDIERLHNRIAAMETSKFWKLRQLWFKFRHVARIPGN
jgi:glutamate-1-semialdehyde 2,1-aminomutase